MITTEKMDALLKLNSMEEIKREVERMTEEDAKQLLVFYIASGNHQRKVDTLYDKPPKEGFEIVVEPNGAKRLYICEDKIDELCREKKCATVEELFDKLTR